MILTFLIERNLDLLDGRQMLDEILSNENLDKLWDYLKNPVNINYLNLISKQNSSHILWKPWHHYLNIITVSRIL